ncbi:hypothetical protein AQUCO_01300562v1 [Aquilegia coerulea]|uniref:Uncharacterized protein n=1 Tax=Aquilegia coerulea TaxID=218851 RepID=A0A2G5E2I0_AQUCA|nr:hypothetical protein AQUCO_01300562v1 [Aquilegia coerulea]
MNHTLKLHFQIQRPLFSLSPRDGSKHYLTNHFPRNFSINSPLPDSSSLRCLRSPSYSISPLIRCVSEKNSNSIEPDSVLPNLPSSNQEAKQNENKILKILKGANSIIPHVVLASTVLALIFPPSFTWFTTRYYAPALGFLMFAVGVNSSEKDFIEAFNRPTTIIVGYIGQFVVKPLLGYLFGTLAVTAFNLPTSLDPSMAPLSIVMTSLSTATAVFVTPALSLLLIGKRLPVDVRGMVSSIMQIVVTPIAAGLLLNRFFPWICDVIRPLLPPLSVFVTALCVGSPLAINIEAVMSPFGLTILLLIIGFHLSSFIAGYFLAGLAFINEPDVKSLQRTLSFETGMQSSLLALALANRFFQDPLVGVPPAISVVIMSLMGFSLVMLWSKKKEIAG